MRSATIFLLDPTINNREVTATIRLLLGVCFTLFSLLAVAQENIPIGTWRSHLSFNSVNLLAEGNNKVFAAADNGVMVYDRVGHTVETYSTLNALSGTGISALAYDASRSQLVVGYDNGAIDLVSETATVNFTRLVNPPDVSVSGSINHILINGSLAYFSTNYGLVLFDLNRNEVKETWRNLGPGGQLLAVYQSVLLNGVIFLATDNGVLLGDLSNNLLDYNQWTRFNSGDLNTSVKLVTSHNESVYCTINQKGVYRFDGIQWIAEVSFPVLTTYSFLQGYDAVLLLGGSDRFFNITNTEFITEITDPLLINGQAALLVEGHFWVADKSMGLLSNVEGLWKAYASNGPFSPAIFGSRYVNNSMLTIHGGVASDFSGSSSFKGISVFKQGLWSLQPSQVDFISDVIGGPLNSLFIASFGEGLEKKEENGNSTILNTDNSPLQNVIALENSPSGLWIANYGSTQSLHLLSSTNELQSFSLAGTPSRYPFKLAVDGTENVWMLIGAAGGGGVVVVKKDGSFLRYLTDQPGAGLLPSKEVLSVIVDKEDYVWIGTAKGVAYYTFTGEDAIRPIVEGRFLLSEERVTALAVDGGNRKWIGTERGVWLFNDSGEELIYNFNTQNSPLLSNKIVDIEIEEQSGEVFITTDKGLISFRSDATTGKTSAEEVKIFPNPVNPGFGGVVGISSLYTDAIVKIVDVSGRLVAQLQANGGMVSWNMIDYNGKRVGSGVYLVIASAPDGSESVAGKIVVVD